MLRNFFTKYKIKKFCKKAHSHIAWRSPFGIWHITLFDKDDMATYELELPDRDKFTDQILNLLDTKLETKKK